MRSSLLGILFFLSVALTAQNTTTLTIVNDTVAFHAKKLGDLVNTGKLIIDCFEITGRSGGKLFVQSGNGDSLSLRMRKLIREADHRTKLFFDVKARNPKNKGQLHSYTFIVKRQH